MFAVCSNTYLNIAASDVLDGNCTIFSRPKYFRDIVQAPTAHRAKSCVRVFTMDWNYDRHTRRTHLASRAWTLQEKILPRRTLDFGNRGALWECQENLANDFPAEGHLLGHGSPLVYSASKESRYSHWQQIMELFSAADQAYGTDKLPVLARIAQAHQEQSQDQYLAGMWR